MACQAEESGYDPLLVPDTRGTLSPLAAPAAAAAATTTLRVGRYVLNASNCPAGPVARKSENPADTQRRPFRARPERRPAASAVAVSGDGAGRGDRSDRHEDQDADAAAPLFRSNGAHVSGAHVSGDDKLAVEGVLVARRRSGPTTATANEPVQNNTGRGRSTTVTRAGRPAGNELAAVGLARWISSCGGQAAASDLAT